MCASRFDKLLESTFCILLVMEAFSLLKVVMVLDEVVVSWRQVWWIWQMRQNFIVLFVQLLTHELCDMGSGLVSEKNWVLSVGQCWLQALEFLVSLMDLLSILLRSSGFAGIQKAVVCQTISSCTNSDHDPVFDATLVLGSALELLSPTAELVFTGCHTFLCSSQSDQEMVCLELEKMTLQNKDFFFFDVWSAHELPAYWAFSHSQFASMSEDRSMVGAEFSGPFSGNCKRVSSDTCSQLVTVGSTSSRSVLCRTWWTTALYVDEQFLRQMHCWTCELSLRFYVPFWTWTRVQICFLSRII